MEFLFVIAVVFLAIALLWGIHQSEERKIAAKGYPWYISYSTRWKKKRKACYKRFGYRCAICNSPHNLQAHHRTYTRLFHELPEDLTCLCDTCHQAAPRGKGLYK